MAEMMERKKLIDYLPKFIQNFSEIKELMRVTNIESDQMYPLIGKNLNEAFIEDCSEYGIRKYENSLGITAVPGESLGFRKNRVRAYWCLNKQYSYKVFVQGLDMLLGGSWNYDIVCDQEHYAMTLNVYKVEHLNMLENFLQKVLPMNISYKVDLVKDWTAGNYFGIIWQDDEILEWR